MRFVKEWLEGCEFRELYQYTDLLEGAIFRKLSWVDRNLESFSKLYKQEKMNNMVIAIQETLQLLRRDILVVDSLYLNP